MGVEESDGEEETQAPTSIFEMGIDVVELRRQEMLEKYPWASS